MLSLLRCKAQIEGRGEGFKTVSDKYVGCCNYVCSIRFFATNAVQAILYCEYKWLVVSVFGASSLTTKVGSDAS